MILKQRIAQCVSDYLNEEHQVSIAIDSVQIDQTRKEFEGDFTLVVFPFVKAMRCAPPQAGERIGALLQESIQEIVSYNVVKGFLNLSLSADYWTSKLIELAASDSWFNSNVSDDITLVEFSSPNTNKPLHLGHLRNIFLGDSVSSLQQFAGKQVVRTQIINDRGVHICKSMLAWQRWGNGETPQSAEIKGDKLIGKYYVIFDQKLNAQVAELVESGMEAEQAKKEAPLMLEVQAMLLKWEQGDEETVALWKKLNSWVYEGFNQTYQRMQVSFDKLYYESDTYLIGKDMVLDGLSKGLFFKKENGSVWCDLSNDGLDEKLLLRADGTSVYMTQDIGTAHKRYEDYPGMTKAIYTVGDEQDYHFKVLFKILGKLGFEWAENCEHLSYGMVDLPSGKMKSREGTVVDADDLMDEVVKAAKASSLEKGKLDEMTDAEKSELFETLGIGALKFYLLRVDPKKRMMFDPEESVSLNGDTGPFVQYTHARCKSVLQKAGAFSSKKPAELHDRERALIQKLTQFRTEIIEAANVLNPAAVASYCIDVAKLYNQFYHDVSILKAEGNELNFRLTLTQQTASTIETAMGLLGINVPDRM